MRVLKLIASICLCYLAILFCLNWHPLSSLFVFGGSPFFLFIVFTILLAIFEKKLVRFENWLHSRSSNSWIIFCAVLTFLGSVYYAFGPLESIPHAWDDVAYLWMARTFASGKLLMESHQLPEFFHTLFFINDGRWYPIFQPGWPLLLAVGTILNIEFFIDPILMSISVVLCFLIARKVFSDQIAALAMMMMMVSHAVHTLGGMTFAHPLSLVLTQISLLTVFRLAEEDRLSDSIILGLSLGWLFLTRGFNAAILFPVVAIPLIYFLVKRKIRFLRLFAGVPFALVFILLQLLYNAELTGSPLTWPQEKYFQMTEENGSCHDLGFGKNIGCPNVHPLDNFPDGFYPSDAVGVIHKRMGPFLYTLLGWSFLLVFIGIPFFHSEGGWHKYALLSVFLSLIAGYFFFYFHGVRGRYYFEASFAIFILIAAGMVQAHRWLSIVSIRAGNFHVPYGPLLRATIPGVILTYFIFSSALYVTGGVSLRNFFGVDRRIEKAAETFPTRSIFFIPEGYNAAFTLLRPGLKQPHLYVRDLGKQNDQMMRYYPGWKYFRYDPQTGHMTKLSPPKRSKSIFTEMETKALSGNWSGEYLHEDKMATAPDSIKLDLSGGAALAFEASQEGSYFTFNQFIFDTGNYDLTIRFLTGPDMGTAQLAVDGKVCPVHADLYSSDLGFLIWNPKSCWPLRLKKGQHKFTIKLLDKNEQSSGYRVLADWMKLIRVKDSSRTQ